MGTQEYYEAGLGLYCSAIALLGGDTRLAAPVFDAIWQSGLQPRRFFHTPNHYFAVAGEENALRRKMAGRAAFENADQAARFKAGCDHDVVYMHIDRKDNDCQGGIHSAVKAYIDRFAEIEIDSKGAAQLSFRLGALTDDECRHIQALNIIFQQPQEASRLSLQWYINQNEYLSALFGLVTGLDLGISAKYLLAEMALVEASVPFGARGRLRALHERLKQANSLWPAPLLSDSEMLEIIDQAELLANQDVSDFKNYFGDFIANSFLLLLENSIGEVSQADAMQIDPQLMASAMTGMADFLIAIADAAQQHSPSRCIFHRADGLAHSQEQQAIRNIQKLHAYLYEASTKLQFLIGRFKENQQRQPKNWGEICDELSITPNDLTIPADAFFHALGAEALAELSQHLASKQGYSTGTQKWILTARQRIEQLVPLKEDYAASATRQIKTS